MNMKKKPPTYVQIPEDLPLSGPYRCPDCNGVTKLDPKQIELHDLFYCPYCLSGLLLPGRPDPFKPLPRGRKIVRGKGLFVNA